MDSILIQVLLNGLIIGGFYAIIGIGLNIIFGVMDVVNFAQGEFLMIGMYVTYFTVQILGWDPYLSLPLVAVVLFGLGGLLQYFLVTPVVLKKTGHASQILLTVAFMFLLQNTAVMLFTADYFTVETSYSSTGLVIGDTLLTTPKLISFGFALLVALLVFLFLDKTDTGKALRATSQNDMGASLVGIRIKRMYVLAFGIGTALAGVAGTLLIPFFYVHPLIGNIFTPRAFVVVVLGGLGSIPGAFIGGMVLGLLETGGAFVAGSALKEAVIFVTFILILILRRNLQVAKRSVA